MIKSFADKETKNYLIGYRRISYQEIFNSQLVVSWKSLTLLKFWTTHEFRHGIGLKSSLGREHVNIAFGLKSSGGFVLNGVTKMCIM